MRARLEVVLSTISVTLVALASACGRPAAVVAPTPRRAAALPPIPTVDGPLRIDVVAPGENEELPTRDSTFVYGSVGTGRATLTIDGAPVRVEPDGAFMAWLAIPASGVYHLATSAGAETATLDRRVRLPGQPLSLPRESARILEGTASPAGS